MKFVVLALAISVAAVAGQSNYIAEVVKLKSPLPYGVNLTAEASRQR